MKSFFKRIFNLKRIAQTVVVILFCSVLLAVLEEKGVKDWVILAILTILISPWLVYRAWKDYDETF